MAKNFSYKSEKVNRNGGRPDAERNAFAVYGFLPAQIISWIPGGLIMKKRTLKTVLCLLLISGLLSGSIPVCAAEESADNNPPDFVRHAL